MNEKVDNNNIKIENDLKKIIAKHLGVKKELIVDSTLIMNVSETRPWGKTMETYGKISKHFDVHFSIEDMSRLTTFAKLLNFIKYSQEH